MELKLYVCRHCGNVIWKVVDKGVPVTCCGEKMEELVPGTTDAAREKHVPDIKREGDTVKITVGSVVHPMLEEHYISMIAAVSGDTATVTLPQARRRAHPDSGAAVSQSQPTRSAISTATGRVEE